MGNIGYYLNKNIPKKTLKLVNEELNIPEGTKLTSSAKEKRAKILKEAISWEKGLDQENRKITTIYRVGAYSVAVGKPGKEASPDYTGFIHYKTKIRGNNPNDMNPQILKNNKKTTKNYTFGDMFEHIEHLMHSDLFGLEILGSLLFRMAFMMDHQEDKEGNIRYFPPKKTIKILKERIPFIDKIPIEIFLYFLDILGINEDIKVEYGGHGIEKDYGRINTLLTFVHLIAVLLNRKSLAKFAGNFARPPSGMAPIPKTERGGIFETYPLLNPNLKID